MRKFILMIGFSYATASFSQDAGDDVQLDGGVSFSASFPLAPAIFVPSAISGATIISAIGSESFAIWADGRNYSDLAIYGTRIAANGQILDPVEFGLARSEIVLALFHSETGI